MPLPFLRIAFGLLLLVAASLPGIGRWFDDDHTSALALAATRPLWRGGRHSRLPAGLVVHLVEWLPLIALAVIAILLGGHPAKYLMPLAIYGVIRLFKGPSSVVQSHRDAEALIQAESRFLLGPNAGGPAAPVSAREDVAARRPSPIYRAHLQQLLRRLPKTTRGTSAARWVALTMVRRELDRVDLLLPPAKPV